jgi:hypothetical protein
LGGDNPVRAIDVFVDELGLAALSFGACANSAADYLPKAIVDLAGID